MIDEDLSSAFARVAEKIDQAERTAGERIGGPATGETTAIARLERSLPVPAGASDWEWLARRLARAIRNGWRPTAADDLAKLAA